MIEDQNQHPAEESEEVLDIIQPKALELIQRAEIDMQVATARKYPRDIGVVKKKMLSFATLDEETAEGCFYTLKRKDRDGNQKKIQGPSVRLAEIAVSCYGNLRAAARIVDNDGKTITSQGICHDLENNTLICVEVRRRITNTKGKTFNEDMQVVTGNAANAIAFRNAVFKVIPGALVKPVYDMAMKVAVGDATTLKTKRDKLFKRFEAMGVDQAQVLHAIEKKTMDAVDLEDIETLIGIGTAIRDGDTTIDQAFPPMQGSQQAANAVADEKLKQAEQAGHTAQTGSPAASPAADQSNPTAEQPGAGGTAGNLFDKEADGPPAGLKDEDSWGDDPEAASHGLWRKIKGVVHHRTAVGESWKQWELPAGGRRRGPIEFKRGDQQ